MVHFITMGPTDLSTAFNALLEDTCVLITAAYLLSRGRLLAILVKSNRSPRETVLLGLFFALVAAVQDFLPDARYPYAPPTLVVTFATLIAGASVGALAATGAVLSALVLRETPIALAVPPAVVASIALGYLARGSVTPRLGFAVGAFAQSLALIADLIFSRLHSAPFGLWSAVLSIPANGFGVQLLLLMIQEARLREDAIRHAAEAEQARARTIEAQLETLRARLNPHFLFNTLSSIAALCTLDPRQAEHAVIRLGELMRRTLEADVYRPVTLDEECVAARAYLEIEGYRLGERLTIHWELEPGTGQALVPPLSLLTLLENAIQHGIAPQHGPGELRIHARCSPRAVVIAVQDNGAGLTPEARLRLQNPAAAERPRGLRMVNDLLRLWYGPKARLRLFGGIGRGTLVAFRVPQEKAG